MSPQVRRAILNDISDISFAALNRSVAWKPRGFEDLHTINSLRSTPVKEISDHA